MRKFILLNFTTVAIRTLLPEVMWSLGNMTLPSNTVKIAIQEIDYKPFIGLFNVTNATLYDPDISGIGQYQECMSLLPNTDIRFTVDYASVVALELSLDTAGRHQVSMKFKNGTADSEFRQLKLFGNTSVTLESFIHELAVSSPSAHTCFLLTHCLVDHYQFYYQLVLLLQSDYPAWMLRL